MKFHEISSVIDCFTKIDKRLFLNVYHPANILLPTRTAGFWIVHDEIESLHKRASIDLGNFVAHDKAIEAIGLVAVGAANGGAAITLYLGIESIIDSITGGGGDPQHLLYHYCYKYKKN